jgi:hypothetical protein
MEQVDFRTLAYTEARAGIVDVDAGVDVETETVVVEAVGDDDGD